MRYLINDEDRQLLRVYIDSITDSGSEIPRATFSVAIKFIEHGSCDQIEFDTFLADESNDDIKQLLAGFNYGQIDNVCHMAPAPVVAPYDEDNDQEYLVALRLSERQFTSEVAIREALERDDALRLQLAIRESELHSDETLETRDTESEPLSVPSAENLAPVVAHQSTRQFNIAHGSRYIAQLLHFGNPAVHGSVQDPMHEATASGTSQYYGNDAL